tara:strand:+ start:494 stop:1243 length:750 start_codon:yes stop_codon:yes gene_type:complete
MTRVTDIFRHPLKSHGREALQQVSLSKGNTMPWDRCWAVAHEASSADGSTWVPCANFSRGSKAPKLMAVNVKLNETTQTLTLSHPERKDFTFQPDDIRQLSGFLAWIKPLMPTDRAQSARIIRLQDRGFTDTDFASISINSHASLRALSEKIGLQLSPLRWRGNIWLDDLEPWAEHSWVGQQFRIGSVLFEGVEPVVRCLATTANPQTGEQDADTLGALNDGWNHQNFGLYARIIESGKISIEDTLELL